MAEAQELRKGWYDAQMAEAHATDAENRRCVEEIDALEIKGYEVDTDEPYILLSDAINAIRRHVDGEGGTE